jgi:MBOAT membrane-bound O-acyltransferase family protein
MTVLLVVMLVAYAVAAVFYGLRTWDSAWRTTTFVVASIVVLASPILIPADSKVHRLVAILNAIMVWVKMADLQLRPCEGPPSLAVWLAYLPFPLAIVWRKLDHEPRYSLREESLRIAIGGVGFVAGLHALREVFLVDWLNYPFAWEHVVKVSTLLGMLALGALAWAAAWRLAGGQARDAMGWIMLAATPAEFWRRYNRPAQQFFFEDVFKNVGGWRRPIAAALITFSFSAIVHEYVFCVPVGAVQLYQTAFFLSQGVAVAATLTLRPRGWAAVLGIFVTLVFMYASSVVFFASANEIVPFYSSNFPTWLANWTVWRW